MFVFFEFRVENFEFRVKIFEFRVEKFEFRVKNFEFRVEKIEFRVEIFELKCSSFKFKFTSFKLKCAVRKIRTRRSCKAESFRTQYQDLITSFIQDSVDKYIPSKTSRSVSLVPWIIPDIRRKIRRKIKHKIVMHNRATFDQDQDQDQDSLLVKRRNDNHSPGPVIRELVPSSHQRSELSNTILCIFSG